MQEYTVKVDSKGTIRWYQNDKYHRIDGPAIEWVDGAKYWFQNGKRHRLDGPAVEYVDGHKEWWEKGKRHRLDGPAVEYVDGDKSWYIEGEKLTEQQFKARTQTPRKVTMQEVVEQFGENVVITKENS